MGPKLRHKTKDKRQKNRRQKTEDNVKRQRQKTTSKDNDNDNDDGRQRHLHETALCFRRDVSERGQHMNTRENQVVPVPLSTDVGGYEEGRRSTVTPAAFVLIRGLDRRDPDPPRNKRNANQDPVKQEDETTKQKAHAGKTKQNINHHYRGGHKTKRANACR
jgi:hypothetical protein